MVRPKAWDPWRGTFIETRSKFHHPLFLRSFAAKSAQTKRVLFVKCVLIAWPQSPTQKQKDGDFKKPPKTFISKILTFKKFQEKKVELIPKWGEAEGQVGVSGLFCRRGEPMCWGDSLTCCLKSGGESSFWYFPNNNTICRAQFHASWVYFYVFVHSIRFFRVVIRNITKFRDFQETWFLGICHIVLSFSSSSTRLLRTTYSIVSEI